MRVLDCLGDDPDVASRAHGRERLVANQRGEVLALDVIHREVILALLLAHFMNGDDVRMLQTGRSRGFGAKSLDGFLARKLPGQDHFDGHDPVQADLPGLIDHAHAAAGNFFQEFVVAEAAHGRCRGGGGRIAGCIRECAVVLFADHEGQLAEASRTKPLQGIIGQYSLALRARSHFDHQPSPVIK